jgi:tRNA-dihydrouridine synthase
MNDTVLYLAPMRGFTDYVFRKTYAEHFTGLDCAVAPFISTGKNTLYKKKHVKDLWPEHNPRLPVIPQLLSNSADDFILLAKFLFDMGYSTINWNLGCPFPMVARKCRGAGLLPHTERIQGFLEAVIPNIQARLSLKLRLGWESGSDLIRLIPVLNAFPLLEIILHPRTGVQRYQGSIDLAAFGACVSESRHPVVYNGDIKTLGDFSALSRRFPEIRRWMIGRGCFSNPFLPQCIQQGHIEIQDERMRRRDFLGALFEAYSRVLDGPGHVLDRMKGFWEYFAPGFPGQEKIIQRIKKTRRTDQYLARVASLFETGARPWGSARGDQLGVDPGFRLFPGSENVGTDAGFRHKGFPHAAQTEPVIPGGDDDNEDIGINGRRRGRILDGQSP